jgi:hypothetical protein
VTPLLSQLVATLSVVAAAVVSAILAGVLSR